MATVCKITLDAAEYRKELEAVVAESRAAAGSLANLPDRQLSVTADATQAKAAVEELAQTPPPEIDVPVTADTAQAEAAAEKLTEELTAQPVEISADVVADTVEISRLKQEIAELEAKEIELQTKVVDDDISRLKGELAALEGKDVSIRTEAETAEIEKLKAVIASLENRKIEIRAEVKSQQLDALRDKLRQLETDSNKTRSALSRLIPASLRNQAAQAFGAVRSEMNKTQGGAGKFLESVLAGGGAIGIVMAGVASVVKLVTGVLTAAKEAWLAHVQTLQANSADLERVGGELQKTAEKEREALSALRELNQQESLSNTQKNAAAKAIRLLQASYRDLNIEVDATTGKLKNFDAVNIAIMRRQTQRQLQNVDAQIKANSKVTGQTQDNLRQRGFFGEYWENFKQTYGFGTAEEDSGAHKGASEKNMELQKQRAELLRRQKEAEELYRAQRQAENADLSEGYRERSRSFEQRKSDDAFNAAQDIDAKIANRRQAIDAERGGRQRAEAEAALGSAQTDYEKARRSGDRDGMLSAEKQILLAKQAILASDEKIHSFEQQIDALTRQRADAYAKLTAQAQYELDYNKLIVAGELEKAAALRLEKELKEQNLKLSEEEKKKILEQREALQKQDTAKQIAEAKEEVALQQLLVDGNYEAYEAEKLRLEMKRQGKKLTEEETQELLEQRKALKELNLRQNLQEQAYGLYGEAMTKAGRGREFEEQKALRDARKAKGGELSEEETAMVKQLSAISYAMANTRETSLGDTSVKTNSLTARGGFAGGAKLPESDKINREIANTNKLQLEQMKQIATICEKLGTF